MSTQSKEMRNLLYRAFDAFWNVIVAEYPQATTGDLSPFAEVRLHIAAEEAVAEWIEYNVTSVNQ